jgi:hypothetical protein
MSQPTSKIKSLRILPPMAIARMGSAEQALDNYRLVVDPKAPLALPKLCGDRTLLIDTATGAIVGEKPPTDERPLFKQGDKIRPLAPFLEVFAEFDDQAELKPLTFAMLAQYGLKPRWRVRFGNDKMHRRTGDLNDRVLADTDWFSGHELQHLSGHCHNFVQDGRSLPMGSVQFLRPDVRYPDASEPSGDAGNQASAKQANNCVCASCRAAAKSMARRR